VPGHTAAGIALSAAPSLAVTATFTALVWHAAHYRAFVPRRRDVVPAAAMCAR
jgi:hypothetical protein